MRIISSSITRGLLCSVSNMLVQYDANTMNREQIIRSFIYGCTSYPILFHSYSYTKLFFYIKPNVSHALFTSTIYELIIWPITTLPFYYFIMFKDKMVAWKKYKEDIVSVVLCSGCFWIPFTGIQTKWISLKSFAPVRLTTSFLYNTLLQFYTSSSTS